MTLTDLACPAMHAYLQMIFMSFFLFGCRLIRMGRDGGFLKGIQRNRFFQNNGNFILLFASDPTPVYPI
jgi:hypothetical protein